MGCSACAQRARQAAANNRRSSTPITSIPESTSNYTIEQLTEWQSKLQCVKSKSAFSVVQIQEPVVNAYLGVLGTVIPNPANANVFADSLDAISAAMVRINLAKIC